MKRAILSINFNGSRMLQKQTETYDKFIVGDFDFYVGDNSRDEWWRKSNKQICESAEINYIPLSIREGDPSRHHGLALNKCLEKLKRYDQVLIVDHDCFPFRRSNIFEDFVGCDMAGIHQIRGTAVYCAPIFLLINNFKKVYKEINLLPIAHLDTGGAMWEWIKTHNVKFVKEYLITDSECEYAMIEGSFMHFIKGSGWDGNPNHEERINKLFEKLDHLINANA